METVLVHRASDGRELDVSFLFGPVSDPSLHGAWTDDLSEVDIKASETDITLEQIKQLS